MKRMYLLVLMVLLLFSLLQATYVGKVYFKSKDGETMNPFFTVQSRHLGLFFDEQIKIGNLRLTKIQNDPIAEMEHHRYSQYYKGLEVYGGQIIKHYKKSEEVGINGEYYRIYDFDVTPIISKEEAVEIFSIDLNEDGLSEATEESKLLIYPVDDGDYHLAYQIVLEKGPGYCMTGIIDAKTGEIILKYSNIQYEDQSIGIGTGYHGAQYKFPTTYYEDVFLLADEKVTRPVSLYTVDWNIGGYVPSDADNVWNYYSAVINAHVFAGWVYDYYYLEHDRHGIDNNNMDIIVNVNWSEDGYDNAHWSPYENQMYFYIPDQDQNAAALDTVAHEYTHGVTQYSSNLQYIFESGALNESLSDIIGAAVEHYWFPKGKGFLKADWYHGEDSKVTYNTNGCRNLANPNSNWQSGLGPDPCHLSQYLIVPIEFDNGGVHLNMTIFSHAYYLLAEGGINKVSGKSVTGIGIEKATRIFYGAWVYRLTRSSNFLAAANALLNYAIDIYGNNSEEVKQTIRAMEAIGYTYVG